MSNRNNRKHRFHETHQIAQNINTENVKLFEQYKSLVAGTSVRALRNMGLSHIMDSIDFLRTVGSAAEGKLILTFERPDESISEARYQMLLKNFLMRVCDYAPEIMYYLSDTSKIFVMDTLFKRTPATDANGTNMQCLTGHNQAEDAYFTKLVNASVEYADSVNQAVHS